MTPDIVDTQRLAANRDATINLLLAMNAMTNLHLRDERRALQAERAQLHFERSQHETERSRFEPERLQHVAERRRLETELFQEKSRRGIFYPISQWPVTRLTRVVLAIVRWSRPRQNRDGG